MPEGLRDGDRGTQGWIRSHEGWERQEVLFLIFSLAVSISVAVTNTLIKTSFGKKGFVWLIIPGYGSLFQGRQGRNSSS